MIDATVVITALFVIGIALMVAGFTLQAQRRLTVAKTFWIAVAGMATTLLAIWSVIFEQLVQIT